MLEALLVTTAAQYPDHIAIVYGDTRISYAQLAGEVRRLRQGLAAVGLGESDSVALLLPNGIEFVVSFYAVAGLGGIVVPINPLLAQDEVYYYCADNRVRAIITTAQHFERCGAISATFDTPVEIILLDAPRAGAHLFAQLLDRAVERQRLTAPIAATTPALCQYSSGSTDRPKKVLRTHANLCGEAEQFTATVCVTPRDVILCVVPLFHAHGLGNCLLAAGRSGATLVILEPYLQGQRAVDVPFVARCQRVAELIERERVSIVPAVPDIFRALAEADLAVEPSFASLRLCFSAGNFLPLAVAQAFFQRFDVCLKQLYGCTEAGGVTINLEDAPELALSVGRPLRDTELAIVDQQGRAVSPGQIGEIGIRSPSLTAGYVGLEALNREVFRDGFFFTGDLGWLDADGRLFITGRKRIFIDVGGRKVDPLEIEAVLASHPSVREVAVVGVPAQYGGEWIKAVVVSCDGGDRHELLRYCAARLANFKLPRVVEFRDALPKSPLGKILRARLRDSAGAELPSGLADPVRSELASAGSRGRRYGIIRACVRRELAELLNVAPAQINPQAALGDFGLSSACAVELQARLQAILGVALSTTMVWQHPSLDALISYIVNAVETQLPGADQGPSDHAVRRPHLPDPVLSGVDVVQLSSEAVQALLNRQLATVLSAETSLGRRPRPPRNPRFAVAAPDDSQHLPDDTVTQLLFKELNKLPS